MRPGHIQEWYEFAKSSWQNESGWKVAAQRGQDTLCYHDCPGRTVKFDFKEFHIPGIEEPTEALPRPEARSQSHDCKNHQIKLDLQQTLAPGDAFVEQTSNFWILFMMACLFGESAPQADSFFCGCKPTLARHQRRVDFPAEGDCAYANFQSHMSGDGQELMVILRKGLERHHFRLVILFRVPDVEQLLSWTSKSLLLLLQRGREALRVFMTRFGISEMRELDAKMYVVLGMRNFHRGPPLIPDSNELQSPVDAVAISCRNGREDLKRWRRFSSEEDPKAFRMAKYLRCFMKQLGHPIMTHEILDGRLVVPYQCVVLREDWLRLREIFWDAFRIQKAAYRRANGGKTAPTLQEDVAPHFLRPSSGILRSEGSDVAATLSVGNEDEKPYGELVVRKTFLEVLEEYPSGCRALKRSKSETGELSRSVEICA